MVYALKYCRKMIAKLNREICKKNLDQFLVDYKQAPLSDDNIKRIRTEGIYNHAINIAQNVVLPQKYHIKLSQTKVADQQHSGRCWIYAALNFLKYNYIKNYDDDKFNFSENYIAFYDLLEKANYFLETVLFTLDMKIDTRLLSSMMLCPIQDAGQWDMFYNIVNKYGVAPKDTMPDNAVSRRTSEMIAFLSEKLREYACVLRKRYDLGEKIEALRGRKGEILSTIFRILSVCLGQPPNIFSIKMYDSNNQKSISPIDFYKERIEIDLDNYISIINAPMQNKPYDKLYVMRYLGNVIEGRPITHLNLPMERIKMYVIKQLKEDQPVWFGCDARKDVDKVNGIYDIYNRQLNRIFASPCTLSKGENLEYYNSFMTHAMVIRGVHNSPKGKPTHWWIEDSHGEDVGNKGLFSMTDEWFDRYVYQVVVNKKYIEEEIPREPTMLEPWDPMGMLAY